MAYRWTAFNAPLDRARGDALLFGATSIEQLKQTISGIQQGPLPQSVVDDIDRVWLMVEHEAGLDNYNLNSLQLADVPDFKAMYDQAHEDQKFPVMKAPEAQQDRVLAAGTSV